MALASLPALAGFKVYANRGEGNARRPFDEGACREPRVVDVRVSSRRYEAYTTAVATVAVEIFCHVDFNSRVMRVKPEDAYLDIVGLLEDWHGSVASVKRDLGSEHFDPVGMRLDGGGDWNIDRETKALDFAVPFTVRGRVKKGI